MLLDEHTAALDPKTAEKVMEITDKIDILLSKNQWSDAAVEAYRDYICKQVLATSLTLTDEVPQATELDMDDYKLYVNIKKN